MLAVFRPAYDLRTLAPYAASWIATPIGAARTSTTSRIAPIAARELGRVRTMYEWDRLAIAPRYGFETPEAYYRAFSIEPYLSKLAVPALLVAAEDDPVIPIETIQPFLPRLNGDANGLGLEVRIARRGGHLGSSSVFDEQVLDWCAANGHGRAD
jgi:predicted alpha/beta-fold hydrolase